MEMEMEMLAAMGIKVLWLQMQHLLIAHLSLAATSKCTRNKVYSKGITQQKGRKAT